MKEEWILGLFRSSEAGKIFIKDERILVNSMSQLILTIWNEGGFKGSGRRGELWEVVNSVIWLAWDLIDDFKRLSFDSEHVIILF